MLGEEGASDVGSSGVRWVLDPIDGTVNYLYGIPNWAVSVAAEIDGIAVVGVVAAPAMGETFVAVRGGGAVRHDQWGVHHLSVNDPVELAGAMVCVRLVLTRTTTEQLLTQPSQLRSVEMSVVDVDLDRVVERAHGDCILADSAGHTKGHGKGWHLGVVGNHRTGSHQGSCPDDSSMKDDRSRTDEAVVLHGASLEVGVVAYDTPVPNHGGMVGCAVDHCPVLNGCLSTNDDMAMVST
jgi:hypothetical protein